MDLASVFPLLFSSRETGGGCAPRPMMIAICSAPLRVQWWDRTAVRLATNLTEQQHPKEERERVRERRGSKYCGLFQTAEREGGFGLFSSRVVRQLKLSDCFRTEERERESQVFKQWRGQSFGLFSQDDREGEWRKERRSLPVARFPF